MADTEPQRGVSERNRRAAAALGAEMGELISPEHFKTDRVPRSLASGAQPHETDVCEYGVGLRAQVGQLRRLP